MNLEEDPVARSPRSPGRKDAPVSAAKRMLFVAGVEGSGTTHLSRLLCQTPRQASVGGNLIKVPEGPDAKRLASKFEQANRLAWDRSADLATHQDNLAYWRKRARQLWASRDFAACEFIVFKRSYPFGQPRDRYAPDLWDIVKLFEDSRILVSYRSPAEAVYSAFRRGFDSDIRRLAIACEANLCRLCAQAQAIGPERVMVVSYEALRDTPAPVVHAIARFCGMARTPKVKPPEHPIEAGRYRQMLEPAVADWLDGFFDERRCAQWAYLSGG